MRIFKQKIIFTIKIILFILLFSSCNSNTDCTFKNGVHDATVNYSNSKTYYYATYTLSVDVQNCKVDVIYFPKGGWLDSDHITPAQLDSNGDAKIIGENGKEYNVHISD